MTGKGGKRTRKASAGGTGEAKANADARPTAGTASEAARAKKATPRGKRTASKPTATPAPTPAPTASALTTEQVEERIRELESQLDRMIDAASQGSLPALPDEDDDDEWFPPHGEAAAHGGGAPPDADRALAAGRPNAALESTPPAAPSRTSVVPAASPSSRALAADVEPTAFDTARELLSTRYYLRKWGRLGLRNRSEEVDDFGYDPVYETRVKPFLDFLYSTYFRVETTGVDRIPAEGRCLLVANHSGTLPFDGLMIRAAVKREHARPRDVRWLAEDFIFHFPFIGSFTTRIGAVRACQENAERLLRQESLVAVFPEGMKGTGKLFRDRYRLQRFGRGGFVKLALRTQTPIVPVAVLGGEETQPLLARLDGLGKPLGFPYVPITPLFPLLGPLGLAPAPTKWRIVFGEPIRLKEGPECAEDELLIGRLGEQIRGTIQEMVDELVRARRSVFFG
jgi:1-acyl-sn-glycerol-3-phosphate acyltransferase